MRKRESGRRAEPGGDWVGGMCALLRGGALAGAACILALLLGAALISAGLVRERWMPGMVLASCVLGALVGGLSAGRRLGNSGLLSGLGVGGVLFLLLLTAGLLAYVRPQVPIYLIDPKEVRVPINRPVHVIQKGASEGVAELIEDLRHEA